MITEEVVVKYESAEAEAKARRFQKVHDEAMDSAVRFGDRATTSVQKLGDAHDKTASRVFQLRMGMYQLGSALAVTGGRTGILMNAFAEMGAMMLSGGVLGFGIGLITAGFTAYNLIAKDSVDITKANTKAFREQLDEIDKYRDETGARGRSARKAQLGGGPFAEAVLLSEDLGEKRDLLQGFFRERDTLNAKSLENAKGLTDAEKQRLDIVNKSVFALRDRIAVEEEELRTLRKAIQDEPAVKGPQLRRPTLGGRDVTDDDPLRLKMPGLLERGMQFDEEARAEAEAGERRLIAVRDLEIRIATLKQEIREGNATRLGELEEKEIQASKQRYLELMNAGAQAFGTIVDSAMTAIQSQAAGNAEAWEMMAAQVIKSLGAQLFGMGTKWAFEGAGELIETQGTSPRGWELVGIGASAQVAGIAMMAGGAHWAGSMEYSSTAGGAGGGGGGDYGAGGSSGFGDAGYNAKGRQDERPYLIIVEGPTTMDERAVLIQRGLDAAHARGMS